MKRGVFVILFILFSSSIFSLTGDFNDDLCVNSNDFFLFAEQFDKSVVDDNRNVIETINKKKLDASYQFRNVGIESPVPSEPALTGGKI